MDRFLCHHGTKGMVWGRRRYQNKDGSLTEAGKARYRRDAYEKEYLNYDQSKGTFYKSSKKSGRSDLWADPDRYVKEDMERSRKVVDSTRNLTSDVKRSLDMSSKSKKIPKMDLSSMTDQEMRNQINRAMLERQYNDLFNPQKESTGRERVGRVLETAGNVLAVGSSALGIALSIRELRGR